MMEGNGPERSKRKRSRWWSGDLGDAVGAFLLSVMAATAQLVDHALAVDGSARRRDTRRCGVWMGRD